MAFEGARDESMSSPPPPGAGLPPVRRPRTQAGPAHVGALARAEPWGAWLWLEDAGLIAVDLRWSHGAGPTVLLMSPQEEWTTPHPQPAAPMYRAWIPAPAGWTWLAIVQHYDDAVDVELATFVPVSDPKQQR